MSTKQSRTAVFWAFLFLVILLAVVVGTTQGGSSVQNLGYAQFIAQVDEGKVNEVTIQGVDISGTLKDGSRFQTVGPKEQDYLMRTLEEHGVIPDFKAEPRSDWVAVIFNFVPMVVLFALLIFMMRQLQSGGGRAMSFGKSKAKLLNDGGRRVTFEDVAGCDEAKDELEEIIQFLKDPRKFTRLGGRIPKGVLLMGPPGTGKTLLARAVAGEAGVPFFSISGSDFVEMFVGVGASRVRDLFEQGKKNAPCIIFIDEIDAVGRHRGAGMGGGHDEREQTLNQLLVEMDGFESNEGVIMMAATNRPDVLDPALMRPGRFDRRVVVDAPDVRGRLGILKVHCRRTPLSEDVDLELIAKSTAGMAGAELENLVNEAALIAARFNKKKIEMSDFQAARDKVIMGPERRSLQLSEADRKRTAYHEAGHAIVSALVPGNHRVGKVSIIPRGRALGVTVFSPDDERKNATVRQISAMVASIMGGRAAEEVVFDDYDTGASNDIKQATRWARAMVTEWGMSEALGTVNWGSEDGEVFLGRDFGRKASYAEATAELIDQEVKRIVDEGHTRAKQVLVTNIHILHRVAQVLLEKETLDGEEFHRLVEAMDPVVPATA